LALDSFGYWDSKSGHAFLVVQPFFKITNCKNLLFSTNLFFQFYFFCTKSFCEVFNQKKKEKLVEYLLEKNTQNFSKILPNFLFGGKNNKICWGEKIHGSPRLELCVSSFVSK
jgi:hypothetical protein